MKSAKIPNGIASAAVTAAALRVVLDLIGAERAQETGDAEVARIYANDGPIAFDNLHAALDSAYPGFLDQPVLPLPPVDGARCWICGCTDERSCEGGCSWIGPDLCSRCATIAAAIERTGRPRLQSYDPREARAPRTPERPVAKHPKHAVDW